MRVDKGYGISAVLKHPRPDRPVPTEASGSVGAAELRAADIPQPYIQQLTLSSQLCLFKERENKLYAV